MRKQTGGGFFSFARKGYCGFDGSRGRFFGTRSRIDTELTSRTTRRDVTNGKKIYTDLCSSRYSSPRVRRERTFEGPAKDREMPKKRRRKKQERRNRERKEKEGGGKKEEFSGLSFARSTRQKCRIGRFPGRTSRKIDPVSFNETNTRPTTRITDSFRWERRKFRFCHFSCYFSSMII